VNGGDEKPNLKEDTEQSITAQKKYKMELQAVITKLRSKFGDNKLNDFSVQLGPSVREEPKHSTPVRTSDHRLASISIGDEKSPSQ
jgi:hypothetical protein